MSMEQGAVYLKAHYPLQQSEAEICGGIAQMLKDYYVQEVPAKPGAAALLAFLAERGISMAAATSSPRAHVTAALDRLGLLPYLKAVFTTGEVGVSKHEPVIYHLAAESVGDGPGGNAGIRGFPIRSENRQGGGLPYRRRIGRPRGNRSGGAERGGGGLSHVPDGVSRPLGTAQQVNSERSGPCPVFRRYIGGTTLYRFIKRAVKEKGSIHMKTALTIAGSDSSGGAGIQADMKTMTANGVYAMSAVTALTAQNTTGVTDILESTPHFLGEQLDAIFTDIFPDAVKIGMVSSADLIVVIAEKLKQYKAKNIVVDPVMVATSGAKLLRDDAVEALCRELLPLAAVLTPNIPEAEILSGMTITDATGMEAAAKYISEKYGCAVLCKGGHKVNDADDLLWRNGFGKWFHGKRIDNPNTHGTGCTLSSAIASNLAKGYDLDESVERAKEYISGALAAMLDLGHGSGPMNHMFALKGAFTE